MIKFGLSEQLIDTAIKRSGRLGNMVEVKKPDEKGCLDILNLYLKGKKVSKNFDRKVFADKMHQKGYTGADIANLVNMARDKMYERCGIYKKMEANTFKRDDLKNLHYISQDFEKSLT